VLIVAETASPVGRGPGTVRRWIWEGPLHAIEDKLYPMAELSEGWKTGDDGSPAPNWVAALHRFRTGQ
jgi:hypothetical protein